MLLRNISGQFIFFDLVSAISGNAVTGASGAISGRKSIDGLSGQIVLSGNIIELGGGGYRANLFDFDTDGKYVGLFFTASGCVPRAFSSVTTAAVSGQIYSASGANATVPIASISGNVGNSGLFVNVPIATVSGINAIVPPGNLSGITVTLLSGQAILASGLLTPFSMASGLLSVEIPYGVLKADMSGVTSEAARSLMNAARKLINKWDAGITNSGILTVFKENDSSTAYTQNLTARSGAAAITSLDTN